MTKCRWADKYKAAYPPRCGKGNPCDVCKAKWAEKQNLSPGQRHDFMDYAVNHW